MRRRTYLTTTTATIGGLTIAGCMGDEATDDDPGDGNGDRDDDSSETTDTDEDDAPEEDETDEEDEPTPGLVGTFDDFETLEEWMAFQDIGSLEADTDRAYDGSQSARLTPREDDGQVRIRRSLDEPIDVRDVTPGLAMTADNRGIVRIQLQDEDGDYVEYSQQVLPDMPLVRKNFGLTRVHGDPDPSEIIVLQVICWFSDDTESQVWVDDFHFVPTPRPER